jgi:hypothetical protein
MIQITNRDLFFLLTCFLILCAMFTKQPTLDDAAKITLGALLKYMSDNPTIK